MSVRREGDRMEIACSARSSDVLTVGPCVEAANKAHGPIWVSAYDSGRAEKVMLIFSAGDARMLAAHLLNLADDADGAVRLNFVPPSRTVPHPLGF